MYVHRHEFECTNKHDDFTISPIIKIFTFSHNFQTP